MNVTVAERGCEEAVVDDGAWRDAKCKRQIERASIGSNQPGLAQSLEEHKNDLMNWIKKLAHSNCTKRRVPGQKKEKTNDKKAELELMKNEPCSGHHRLFECDLGPPVWSAIHRWPLIKVSQWLLLSEGAITSGHDCKCWSVAVRPQQWHHKDSVVCYQSVPN